MERIRPQPLQKASVKSTSEYIHRAQTVSDEERLIWKRIVLCMARENHAYIEEAEARAAVVLASQLMQQHNVELSSRLKRDYAGSSVVAISKTRGESEKVVDEGFVAPLSDATTMLFDCKCYATTRRTSIEWTFYGIPENTVAAAMAFSLLHNVILERARAYPGGSPSHSYCRGVADELCRISKEEKDLELRKARLEELVSKRDSVETISIPSDDAVTPCSSNYYWERILQSRRTEDDDSIVRKSSHGSRYYYDISNKKYKYGIPTLDLPPTSTGSEISSNKDNGYNNSLENKRQGFWKSEAQLLNFRHIAGQIADEFLMRSNIKLIKGKRSRTAARDYAAYTQGQEDSNNFDPPQKRIKY